MKLHVIYVEGNIGSGKSTILQSLSQLCKPTFAHIIQIPEPIKLWTESGALEWLYTKKIDSKIFQNMVLTTRATNIITSLRAIKKMDLKEDDKILIVVERGLQFGCQAFAKMNSFSPEEDALYTINNDSLLEIIYNIFRSYDPNFIEKYFYIKVSTSICASRINYRERNEEKNIDLQYLKKVEIAHNEMQSELIERGHDINIVNGELQTSEVCKNILTYL